jgi:hypothetical protein
MRNSIETGDTVSVSFVGAQFTLCKSAKVLHIPCATGDGWHFKDNDSGQIFAVSEGCTIELLNKAGES